MGPQSKVDKVFNKKVIGKVGVDIHTYFNNIYVKEMFLHLLI